jgi:hypothetical protein
MNHHEGGSDFAQLYLNLGREQREYVREVLEALLRQQHEREPEVQRLDLSTSAANHAALSRDRQDWAVKIMTRRHRAERRRLGIAS